MTTAPEFAVPAAVRPVAATVPRLIVLPPDPADRPLDDLDAAFERARPRLHRYAVRRLGDPHEAEEVVQEALLRGYQHRATFATEDDLNAWLTVVTGRLAIDRLRVRGRSISVAEVPPGARTSRDTAEVVVARAEARIALDALEAMPGRQAAVLWAREVDGLSYDEIAHRYGLSEPTVRSLLHRARRALRREYSARGGTVPVGGLLVLAPWLRGMRFLTRLRDLGRKSGAASVAVTGLAVAGVLAIGATPVHVRPLAPPTGRAEVVGASHTVAATIGPTAPDAPPHPTAVARADAGDDSIDPVLRACSDGVGVNCRAPLPTHPVLYVGPAAIRTVGVTTGPLDCHVLPATPLSSCENSPDSATPVRMPTIPLVAQGANR